MFTDRAVQWGSPYCAGWIVPVAGIVPVKSLGTLIPAILQQYIPVSVLYPIVSVACIVPVLFAWHTPAIHGDQVLYPKTPPVPSTRLYPHAEARHRKQNKLVQS